jgi:hypothetical protein
VTPTAATAPDELQLALNVVMEPDPMQSRGLQSSTLVSLDVRDPSATGGAIDLVRFVVRDTLGEILLQTEVKGPLPFSSDGAGRVSERLSWGAAHELGRTLEMAIAISDARGTRTLERTFTF